MPCLLPQVVKVIKVNPLPHAFHRVPSLPPPNSKEEWGPPLLRRTLPGWLFFPISRLNRDPAHPQLPPPK